MCGLKQLPPRKSRRVASPAVSLISDAAPGPATLHGLSKVKLALQDKGIGFEQIGSLEGASGEILIVCGIADGAGAAGKLLEARNIAKPQEAESLLIRHVKSGGKKTLLVSGADDRGLMYALLDVADRIGWAADPKNPLSEVRNAEEKPAVAERALSIYTMHQGNFESYLPEYAKSLPSDTQQFLSIDNAAKYRLEGTDSAQFSPEESSRWFERVSKDVLGLVNQAEQKIGEHKNKEFDSTIVDLKILAYLAFYHSHRAKAGLSYALFSNSGDIQDGLLNKG